MLFENIQSVIITRLYVYYHQMDYDPKEMCTLGWRKKHEILINTLRTPDGCLLIQMIALKISSQSELI